MEGAHRGHDAEGHHVRRHRGRGAQRRSSKNHGRFRALGTSEAVAARPDANALCPAALQQDTVTGFLLAGIGEVDQSLIGQHGCAEKNYFVVRQGESPHPPASGRTPSLLGVAVVANVCVCVCGGGGMCGGGGGGGGGGVCV